MENMKTRGNRAINHGFITGFMCVILIASCVSIMNKSILFEDTEYIEPSDLPRMSDPTSFISIWNTTITDPGSSGSRQIRLPLDSDGIYNFTVNWGDGSNDTITACNQTLSGESNPVTHTYASGGIFA